MATLADWVEGARPRTLPNAVSPVLVGTGAALAAGGFSWWRALLALIVAVAMVVGVNFANDYSDGVRGTDAQRTGPMRLVGSGAARPRQVLVAAMGSFGLAAVVGLVLVIVSGQWALLILGAVCLLAAWFYTGGPRPYGYSGFGEVVVFLVFGPIAVLGTELVQAGSYSGAGAAASLGVGSFSAAVLLVNNLRDIDGDAETGKHTLAVRLGSELTRQIYVVLLVIPFGIMVLLGTTIGWVLVGAVALLLAAPAGWRVLRGAEGLALVGVLRNTALGMLVWSAAIGAALAIGV